MNSEDSPISDFHRRFYNCSIVNSLNNALQSIDSLGDLCSLLNDPSFIIDQVESAKTILIQTVESTIIEDKDSPEIDFCPDCESEENSEVEAPFYQVMPTFIEVVPSDGLMRAVMFNDDEIINITDSVNYHPDTDCTDSVAEVLELMAAAVRRKRILSLEPKKEDDEGPTSTV